MRNLGSLNLFCSSVGGRIEHDGGLYLAVLHGGDGGRGEPDADDTGAWFGSMPFLASRYFRKKSVEEPGAGDAHRLAGEVLYGLDVGKSPPATRRGSCLG